MNQPATAAMQRDDRPRLERVDHERVVEELWTSETGSRRGAGSSVRVAVGVVGGRLGLADDDEPPVGGSQDLDRDAVERAQRLARDHLARAPRTRSGRRRRRRRGRGRASSGLTSWATSSTATLLGAADPGERAPRRRSGSAGRGCRAARRAAAARGRRRAPARSAAAAARRPSSSPIGRRGVGAPRRRARSPRRRAHAARGRAESGRPQRSPSSPSRTRSTPRIRVDESKRVPLREVADVARCARPAARRGRRACPARSGSSAEQHAQERRLAGAVRAEHGDELARLDRERRRRSRPSSRRSATAAPRSSTAGPDAPGHRPVARWSAAIRPRARRPATARSRASRARASR